MVGFIIIMLALISGPLDAAHARGGLLRSEAIRDAVERFIHDRCDGAGTEVGVEFRSIPDSIPVAGNTWTLRVDDGGARDLRGRTTVLVEVSSEGKLERRLAVSVMVRTFGSVLVASKQLERHARIGTDDVRLEAMETTTLPKDVLGATQTLTDMRTKRIIGQGSVLTESSVEQVPVVSQGEIVRLKVRSKSVLLTLQAIAKEDGRAGRLITVQKIGSHDRVKARVVGPGTVEIDAE